MRKGRSDSEPNPSPCCGDLPNRREKRRHAMLAAARKLFLEHGYGATSLSDIVKLSGGSLATLYDLFGGKPGLFRAMIESECSEAFRFLDDEALIKGPPEVALRRIAEMFFDRGVVAGAPLLRLVVAEAAQFPEIGAEFHNAGPQAGEARIARYLTTQIERGVFQIDDPSRLASIFPHLVFGKYHMRVLCGLPVQVDPGERERHLDWAIDSFLTLCRPPRPPA